MHKKNYFLLKNLNFSKNMDIYAKFFVIKNTQLIINNPKIRKKGF